MAGPDDKDPPAPPDDGGDEGWTAAVPDAMSWPEGLAAGGGLDDDDVFLGAEAAVPPRDYAPPRPTTDAEVGEPTMRELERRVDAHRTPAFPLDLRRRVGLPFLWKRWRRLAMMGKSEVVDDFGRDPIATARWEPLLDFLYSRWFRVEATGLEHVPARPASASWSPTTPAPCPTTARWSCTRSGATTRPGATSAR